MKDDYNYAETPYSRKMEGQYEGENECPHGLLIRDEDCPDCADEAERKEEDRQHDTWDEHRGLR